MLIIKLVHDNAASGKAIASCKTVHELICKGGSCKYMNEILRVGKLAAS